MCLGKNGGYFQMGGYDKTGHIQTVAGVDDEMKWAKMMHPNEDFKVPMRGIMINNHLMNGSSSHKVAFVDSGTTFSYMNLESYNALKLHF